MSVQEPDEPRRPSGSDSIPTARRRRRLSVSTRSLFFLSITFLFVVVLGAVFTLRFGRLSSEGLHLSRDLHDTLSLNAELAQGVSEETALLRRQVESPEPGFAAAHRSRHYALIEKEMKYLKLDIGDAERLRVEQIRAIHGELALRAGQLLVDLESGDRDRALARLRLVERLGDDISRGLDELELVQIEKLSSVIFRVDHLVGSGKRAIVTLAAVFLVVLALAALHLRKYVLEPLRELQTASEAIRRGDFSARAPVLRDDELGHLAKGFNFMAASLGESYASLERKVAERTLALGKLQEQLVQSAKMSAVGQLVSGVAHELNNPLTAILGFSELLRAKVASRGGDPAEIERLDEIAAEAERCRRIVANLLQFARRRDPRLEAVRLNEVVEGMLRLRDYELGTRNIRLERSYDPGDPVLMADPSKLQQVVLNLLNNARDAVLETGRPGRIVVATGVEGDLVTLRVDDDGPGMREPGRVFEPFYTTKEVGKGTGLGLSVCYGIVEEHEGAITAVNLPGGGASFLVALPKGEAALVERIPSQAGIKAPGRRWRALVVDDEKPLVALQISFLAELGVDAAGVASGEEAVHYLQGHGVDLVISDVRMPGAIDGLKLFDWVGAHRPELTDRFLLVSGDVLGMDDGAFARERSVPCLQKPFRFVEYARVVRKVLDA